MNQEPCAVCGRLFPSEELISGHGIRHELEALIVRDVPSWTDRSRLCRADLDRYRSRYVSGLIEEESGRLTSLKSEVARSIVDNELIVQSSEKDARGPVKVGALIADKVAAFGGSWRFIIMFFVVLLAWIAVNSVSLLSAPFDPYPYILMNLILSCLAAIQAPIIMMSQNRQEEKDRARSENDYKVNLKAEIEIRTLHEKVDHLLLDQWAKMMKIQELQIEMLEEIRTKVR